MYILGTFGPTHRQAYFWNTSEILSFSERLGRLTTQRREVNYLRMIDVWERTKKYSGVAFVKAKEGSGVAYSKAKPGFDYAWNKLDKLGAPVNRLTNRLGSEAFWPTTLDKESDKAARILRSFCKDGFYSRIDEAQAKKAEETGEAVEGPRGKQRVLKKIPEKVIKNAKGLAIFTTMRTGLWVSGAGGSGILVARHPQTGEWSPPSGILLHTAGLGFLIGVDIYDCVIVINTYKALEAFTKIRCTLGGEVSAVAGPVGMGGVLESEVHARQAPVWTYLKSRGFYAGVQVDGTIVIERKDENEKFYGERIPVADILNGRARTPPKAQYKMLMDTVHAAQGEEVDDTLLPDAGQSPSDYDLDGLGKLCKGILLNFFVGSPATVSFGIPDADDPDPYGVKALEAEGLAIREAGTHQRPSAEAFDFKPAPTSPLYSTFARKSIDGALRRASWRDSTNSLNSVDRGTQTSEDDRKSRNGSSMDNISQHNSPHQKETQHVDESDDHSHSGSVSELDEDDDQHAVIATATPVVAKARMVSVPTRTPPSLPPRNPNRVSTPAEEKTLSDSFEQVSLNGPTISEQAKFEEEQPESHRTSNHNFNITITHPDDEFHSIPGTPTEHKEPDFPATYS